MNTCSFNSIKNLIKTVIYIIKYFMSLFYLSMVLENLSNVYNLTMYKIINFSYFVRLSLKLIIY